MAAPIFSYAQAAKGLTPTMTPATQPTNPEPSPVASDAVTKESTTTNSASTSVKSPVSKPHGNKSPAAESTSKSPEPTVTTKAEKENSVSPEPASASAEEKMSSSIASLNLADTGNASSTVDAQGTTSKSTTQTDGSEKDSSDVALTEKTQLKSDKEKVRDSEDDWEKVSLPSIATEKELKAAPIPSVNIWQQRKEAQEAKKRETGSQRPLQTVEPLPVQKPRTTSNMSEDAKKQTSHKEQQSGEKTANTPKGRQPTGGKNNDRKDGGNSSQIPRSASQPAEKTAVGSPPPVGDAKSWPTPENAITDERRKSAIFEKIDRGENNKPAIQKVHGKQWVQIPFVPTAKFETQLPPAANARRGGRQGGRPRDGINRSVQSGNNPEKPEGSGSMGPPALPKQGGELDRGRKSDEARSIRASSAPTDTVRPAGGNDGSPTTRKPSGAVLKDATAGSPTAADASVDNNRSSETPNTVSPDDFANPPSQNNSTVSNITSNDVIGNIDTSVEYTAPPVIPQTRTESVRQPSLTSERNRGSAQTGRIIPDNNRERIPRREWSRDKSDSAKEKVESWRDREVGGETTGRRDSRTERGVGRGSYRARNSQGQYGSFGGSHAFTAPLPQNGFELTKSSTMQEPRSRQSSQPFTPNQTPNGNRNISRSQSIPSPMMYPGFFQPNMQSALSPLQTDMSMYGYTPQMSLQPGIMSAMPYNETLNSYAMLSMVGTQVEYYFSIDNLCKDLFLRKHMDSQGFVPLSIIANFQRIKTLTEDNGTIETLRQVCQRVESVELIQNVDGEDHLRRRDGWKDFVLPMEDRHPAARNDGPNLGEIHSDRQYDVDQMRGGDPSYFAGVPRNQAMNMPSLNGHFQSMSAYPHHGMTSFDGQMPERGFMPQGEHNQQEAPRRSPATSPFSQEPVPTQMPEHRPQDNSSPSQVNGQQQRLTKTETVENVFPDERIGDLYLFLKDSSDNGHPNPSSSDGRFSASARVSGLRGGDVERMDRFRGLTFGKATPQIPKQAATEFYLTKDGEEMPLLPPRPGIQCIPYVRIRDEILKERYEDGSLAALEPLYSFWSSFLIENFNVVMYEEFKTFAQKDAQDGNESGTQHLHRYFNKLLNGSAPMTERTSTDLVNLARQDHQSHGPVYQMLRAAWRNGATNLKTRKRLGDVLTKEEQAEFDRGG